ncbi:MAG: hypothetical protein WBO55_14180 [Rhizobiaceae bacterium]
MLKILNKLVVAIALLIPIAAMTSTQADAARISKGGHAMTVFSKFNRQKAAPISTYLTDKECTGLGGKIEKWGNCADKSGNACVTTDVDGVKHGVCIDKAIAE